MMSVLFALLLQPAHATTMRSYLRNRDGVRAYNDKSYYPAYQNFLKALESDPLNPEVQLNLGRTFEANEEFPKAEAAYRGALKLLPPRSGEHFAAMFNLGNVLAKEKKIDQALAAYQDCLALAPDSKEVKTNIELLMQNKGGGGGEGQNQDNKDNKDNKNNKSQPKEGQDKKPNQPQEQKDQQQANKPRPFESKELSPQDVKKILDEIKNQEQSIRAQEYEHKGHEQGNARDW